MKMNQGCCWVSKQLQQPFSVIYLTQQYLIYLILCTIYLYVPSTLSYHSFNLHYPLLLKVIGGELQERLIPVPYSKSSTDQAVSCFPTSFCPLYNRVLLIVLVCVWPNFTAFTWRYASTIQATIRQIDQKYSKSQLKHSSHRHVLFQTASQSIEMLVLCTRNILTK